MALIWAFLLVLAPLLAAWEQEESGTEVLEEAEETGRCEAPSDSDPNLQFAPVKTSYALNDVVQLSCAEGYQPSVPALKCISSRSQTLWNGTAICVGTCQRPRWGQKVLLEPDRSTYRKNEEVSLSCARGLLPDFSLVKCSETDPSMGYTRSVKRDVWLGRTTTGHWIEIHKTVKCVRTCQRPQWDQSLQLTPDYSFYKKNEVVNLSCPWRLLPEFSQVICSEAAQSTGYTGSTNRYVWKGKTRTGDWIQIQTAVRCTGTCQRPQWDQSLQLSPDYSFYKKNEVINLSCPWGLLPDFSHVICSEAAQSTGYTGSTNRYTWKGQTSTGGWIQIQTAVRCPGTCQRPQSDQNLQLTPNYSFYKKNEVVNLSCPWGLLPEFSQVICSEDAQYMGYPGSINRYTWKGKTSPGHWIQIQTAVRCTGTCQRPQWDQSLQLTPDYSFYKKNEVVSLSCPWGLLPDFSQVICSEAAQSTGYTGSTNRYTWKGQTSTGDWIQIQTAVRCTGMCRRPQWDQNLQLTPDQRNYRQNEEVMLSCPEGLHPSFTEVKCATEVKSISYGKPVYGGVWMRRNGTAGWIRLQSDVKCTDVLLIVPGTLEVSATSIKLNWTCRFPHACERMQAMCRLALPSSPPCEAKEITGEEMLQGEKGTFTCPLLQPFTVYRVTISLHPSTFLYTRLVSTKEAVPDKPQNVSLDASTGLLSWNALPPCKGEILAYQLSITARDARESGFLEIERLRLEGSVTEYALPEHRPGRTYVVTVQGVTAAGAGPVSRREFHGSDTSAALNISSSGAHGISPSRGTAVLPLRPITQAHTPQSEHQLVVAQGQEPSALAGVCSAELQPFNASRQPRAYVAAVLNLTAPTDFVLGDGSRRHGYYNAPLQPDGNYTVLLRLVRRGQQAEKFTCVGYSVSGGQEPISQLGRMMVIAVALVVALLALGILLLFLLFRRKHSNSKAYERNSTIPLRKCRGGANKMNTRVPVEELLEVLKKFKREELEAEQTDDESVNRPGAGRLGEYQNLVSTLLHPCDAGKELCNQDKNRYKNVVPYDHCRVVLQSSGMGNDYINASYVESYQSPRFFIAAQGPLSGSVVDFWQMIWQEKTSVIVMLTDLVEQNKTKCEQYWPEQEQVYGDFTVTLNNTRSTTGLITRTFCLKKTGCALPRLVEQLHYLLWPDHGVPRNPTQLLYLVEKVNKKVSENPTGPVVVHCSAGIGRTGTFIALDFLLKMGKAEGKVDVFRCVQKLREQRVSMVQTKEQYTFLYEVLLEGLLCGSTGVPMESISSHISRLQEAETQRQNMLEKEFKALQKFSEFFQLLPCREAEKPSNQPKNRKAGILPADSCRPILMSSLNADGSPSYINAVFTDTHPSGTQHLLSSGLNIIRGGRRGDTWKFPCKAPLGKAGVTLTHLHGGSDPLLQTYTEEDRIIVTQLPLLDTLVDFWALVWDYTCTLVVVLNQLQELDQTYVEFWPTQGEAIYGRFRVQMMSEEAGAGFTVRTLALTNRQQPKKCALKVQFCQLEDWPMKQNLPPCPATIISLLGKVGTHQRQNQDAHILVTCWDGASRSGIFCAANFICEQIQSEGVVDVSQAVRMLKRRRRQMIKDVEQYQFCYELALIYLNSFETYGNFK